ncbi:aldolase/citrate lyase family protein [Intrasporangium mesophilum]
MPGNDQPTPTHQRDRLDIGSLADALDDLLLEADRDLASRYPGLRAGRQPVHTVYVPADRLEPDLVAAWGAAAAESLDFHADTFSELVGDPEIEEAVRRKLATEPIEDLRIDFEDGYGNHADADEDAAVDRAAALLRDSLADGTAPPFTGIRFKSFEAPTRRRGLRTLARFLEAVAEDGSLPSGFVVTLPKVTSVAQVEAMVHAADRLEHDLALGTPIGFEIQVETPQSILGPDGTALVARMIHVSAGRCTGLHYGTYDYSASLGIAAEFQAMDHPAADHAKAVMQVAAAETGVRLSDGSTNVIPVGSPEALAHAWALHHRLVGRSLARGFYQGWDLHPAQLPTRYAAVFAFYRKGFDAAATRLGNYVARRASEFMDEPATARALADFVLRGLDCGAVDPALAMSRTGLSRDELAALARRT